MATVQTVLGPIDAADLGPTLVHEHVVVSYPGDQLDPTGAWDRAACVDTAVRRMKELQDFGVRTFVDVTVIESRLDTSMLPEIAERSGMQIVSSTGFYFEHIGIPYYWRVRTQDEITELYLHEIEHGIGPTGVRPGVIKIAIGDPPTDQERKVIAAAAVSARESGLSVISHCENAKGWDVQLDILGEHGVDLSRCLIGHQDQAPSSDQLNAIIDRGAYAGVDRIGFDVLAPEDVRVGLIKGVLDAGHADRLCLSMDHACYPASPRFPYFVPDGLRESFEQTMRAAVEDQMWRRPHTYLFTDFIPKLEAAGIERATIDSILTDNPRRLFGG
jgi:phosphotriesterase-related protein